MADPGFANGRVRSSAAGASIEAPKEPRGSSVGRGRGNPLPTLDPLGAFGASILAPAALDLGPPFANPASATGVDVIRDHIFIYVIIMIIICIFIPP